MLESFLFGPPQTVQTQRRVRSDGRHVARVDFLYAEFRTVVEVSGASVTPTRPTAVWDAQRATSSKISAAPCTNTP